MDKGTKMKAPTKEALREQLVTHRNLLKNCLSNLNRVERNNLKLLIAVAETANFLDELRDLSVSASTSVECAACELRKLVKACQ
jgi:hypothetical protein